MKSISYNLPRTVEMPMRGFGMLLWISGAARKPDPGQRVVFCGPRGNYLSGQYERGCWIADADDLHPKPYPVDYQPSIWRPA